MLSEKRGGGRFGLVVVVVALFGAVGIAVAQTPGGATREARHRVSAGTRPLRGLGRVWRVRARPELRWDARLLRRVGVPEPVLASDMRADFTRDGMLDFLDLVVPVRCRLPLGAARAPSNYMRRCARAGRSQRYPGV